MHRISPELKRQREAVAKRLNPTWAPYLHTFSPYTGKCTDCHRKLVDEVYTDENGVQRIKMWCAVIGPDEVAQFRNVED